MHSAYLGSVSATSVDVRSTTSLKRGRGIALLQLFPLSILFHVPKRVGQSRLKIMLSYGNGFQTLENLKEHTFLATFLEFFCAEFRPALKSDCETHCRRNGKI